MRLPSACRAVLGCLVLLQVCLAAQAEDLKPEKVAALDGPANVAAEFSRDGKRILTAGENEFQLWDAATYKPLIPAIKVDEKLKSAHFDVSGRLVLTVGTSTARVWDAQTGKPVSPKLQHLHEKYLRMALLSPDGEKVLTIANEPPDPKPGIKYLGVNPELPETNEEQKRVYVWDRRTGEACLSLKHVWFPDCAAFSPDGSRILTVCATLNGSATLWDAKTGKEIFVEPDDVMRGFPSCAFSADGKRFILGGWYRATIHDAATGKKWTTLNDFEHEDLPSAVAISPTGDKVAVLAQSSGLRIWKIDGGTKPLLHNKDFYNDMAMSLLFSPFGEDCFVGGYASENAGVWSTETGKHRWAVPEEMKKVAPGRFDRDGTVWFFQTGRRGATVYRLSPAKKSG